MARKARKQTPGRLTVRGCGTMEVHYRLLESHPEFRRRQLDLQRRTERFVAVTPLARVGVTRVPVVVHVVYNAAAENLKLSQIRSQISVLNRDYRLKNPDRTKAPAVWTSLEADARVEFYLAKKDPKGKATKGVTRTKTTRTSL